MNLPDPPRVDLATAHEEYWPSESCTREKQLRHIGIIVSKTGHDRGQKEMYLYSPTVKRDDGRIVCSNDFLNFEVGDWILFNVLANPKKQEVYIGGKKFPDPILPTSVRFDSPQMKVRACIYPNSEYQYQSLVSRQQTYRCYSPDLGDVFIDSSSLRHHDPLVKSFLNDSSKLFEVIVCYHFNASIFNEFAGEDKARKVYWRIEAVEKELTDVQDSVDYDNLIPWSHHVNKYLQHRRTLDDDSDGVPPWYIRSPRVLTSDMIECWEEEAKKCHGMQEEKDHPFPYIIEDGKKVQGHPSGIFERLKVQKAHDEEQTQMVNVDGRGMISQYSWKKVMSFDGKMLEPGSTLPPVSNVKKGGKGVRVDPVQDSAGFFMSNAAAQSYCEIKEKATNAMWVTGGWKPKPKEWDAEKNRWIIPSGSGEAAIGKEFRVAKGGPKKNLLGATKATLKAPPVESISSRSSSVASMGAAFTETPSYSAPLIEAPKRFSFASAAKIKKDSSENPVEAEKDIDPAKLNEDGKALYVKFERLKKYVRGVDEEANKPPSVKGFTSQEYSRAQLGTIKCIEIAVKLGIRKEKEARREIMKCKARIAREEERFAMSGSNEDELVEIHLTKEQDADMKELLRGHVEIKKNVLEEMRKKLLEMQNGESKC